MKGLQYFLNEQEQLNENKLTDFLKGTWKTIKGGAKALMKDFKDVEWELVKLVEPYKKAGKNIPDGMIQVQLRHPVTKKGYKAHIIKDGEIENSLSGKKRRRLGDASKWRPYPEDFEPTKTDSYIDNRLDYANGVYKGDKIKLPNNVEILPLEEEDKIDMWGDYKKGKYKKLGIR